MQFLNFAYNFLVFQLLFGKYNSITLQYRYTRAYKTHTHTRTYILHPTTKSAGCQSINVYTYDNCNKCSCMYVYVFVVFLLSHCVKIHGP